MGAAAAPVDEAQVAFTFQDPAITESSGLAVVDGLVVTTNDSGDTGRLFAVDPATGETVGTSTWSDDPTDVEALAPSPTGDVWVGDIGDNREARDDVEVALVAVRRAQRRGADAALPAGLPRRRPRRRGAALRPHHRPAVRRDEGRPRRHAVRRAGRARPGRAERARAARRRDADRHRRRLPGRRHPAGAAQLRGRRPSTPSRPWSGSTSSGCPSQEQGEAIARRHRRLAAAQLGGLSARTCCG